MSYADIQIDNQQINLLDLSGLCKTSLIPLWIRWNDYKSDSPILSDQYSFEILENSNFDTSIFNEINPIVSKYTQLGIIIREKIFDDYLSLALTQFGSANIVNLGCGLDPRYKRFQNFDGNWYDLDLPELINIKSRFFDGPNYSTIASDMFDIKWMDDLDKKSPHIFLCEGTLMYFNEEKVLALIDSIKKRFPKSVMIFEIMGSLGRNKIHPFVKRLDLDHKYKWGIKNLNWFSKNDIKLNFYSSFLDYHKERWGFIANLVNRSSYLKLNIASQIYYIEND